MKSFVIVVGKVSIFTGIITILSVKKKNYLERVEFHNKVISIRVTLLFRYIEREIRFLPKILLVYLSMIYEVLKVNRAGNTEKTVMESSFTLVGRESMNEH